MERKIVETKLICFCKAYDSRNMKILLLGSKKIFISTKKTVKVEYFLKNECRFFLTKIEKLKLPVSLA